jgi:hypothetical protein
MQQLQGLICFVIGHNVHEWVPFVRRSQRGELGLCLRCERVMDRTPRMAALR